MGAIEQLLLIRMETFVEINQIIDGLDLDTEGLWMVQHKTTAYALFQPSEMNQIFSQSLSQVL